MKKVVCFAALLLLCSAVTAMADAVIYRGIDTFTTTSDGSTRYSFADNPIPAGFFCKGSPAFAGEIPLKGQPIVTAEKGQLGEADTIVERLDDAVFDKNGVAVTRVKMAALSLVSIEPFQTTCGAFDVRVTLAPTQREAIMRIYREHDHGGRFIVPLTVDGRMRFVPVGGDPSRALELKGGFNFQAVAKPWAMPTGRWFGEIGTVHADTDGDGIPDRVFAGTTNFAAGYHSAYGPRYVPTAEEVSRGCNFCYWDGGKYHCTLNCCSCAIP